MKSLTLWSTRSLVADSIAVLNREEDLALAEAAIASNLELLVLLLREFPEDIDLLINAAQGFGSYAFAFVEDQMEAYEGVDDEMTDWHRARARRLYNRARMYGLRALQRIDPTFPSPATTQLEPLQEAIARLGPEAVPALFWTAYAWANYINLDRESLRAIAELPKTELLMRRVLVLDEGYFHAGPHLFFAVYYGGRSRLLGGDPAKARFHLERALELTQGKFLLVHFFYARFYAVQTQDRSLYLRMLHTILDAPVDLYPEQTLANQIAKKRARRYLHKVDEFFG